MIEVHLQVNRSAYFLSSNAEVSPVFDFDQFEAEQQFI